MSRQDKATTEKNARILRDLVKQPDNKSCADCRKNDARWASWNLGVYLCIRCSGIHRSMGTHISRVKSIDLDIWTPEQMETVQKWGNKRANLYWERHLKAGHVPPDHKIESFIRSKYESRRWAMDGPPPADPSELENGAGQGFAPSADTSTRLTPTGSAPAPAPAAAPAAAPSRTHPLLSRTHGAKPSPAPPRAAPVVDLFGSDDTPLPATTTAPPAKSPQQPNPASAAAPRPTAGAAPPAPTATSNIFDLDFKAPTPSAASASASASGGRQGKADIMSLFSQAASPPTSAHQHQPAQTSFFNDSASSYGNWGGGITSSAPPQQYNPTQTQLPQSGGGWGGMQMDQGGWGQPVQAQAQPQPQPHQTQTQGGGWGNMTSDPWASNGTANTNGGANGGATGGFGFGAGAPAQPVKKDDKDPFANLWS